MLECNKALLAKQVWCIIHYPESLLARVLKTRNFKDNDILDAKRGWKPSFIWQSILWSQDLIVKGIRWCVGCGQSTRALKDDGLQAYQQDKVQ